MGEPMAKPSGEHASYWQRIGANRTVLALSYARMADGIGNSLLFIVIPLYVARLSAVHFPYPETVRAGILLSLFGLVAGFAQPFVAALVDRLNSRKPFVVGGLLLLTGASISYVFTDRYLYTLVIRAVQGLGLAMTLPPTMAILTDTTKRESRGGAMGIFVTFRVASIAVGPLLGGFIRDHYGFNAAFLAGAGFILLAAILVAAWVKEVKVAPEKRRPFKIFDRELASPAIFSAGFAIFVMANSFAMIAPLEQKIDARLGQSATAFAVAFSILMLTRIALQIPVGHLSDRIGRKGLVVGGLIAMAAASAPIAFVTSTWQLIVLRVLQGIASAAVAAPALALAGDLASAGGEGRQMAILTMGFGFGIAIGTLMSGLLAVVSFSLPFLVLAGLTLVAAWTVNHYVRETGSPQDRRRSTNP
jgi:MFS family permease